MFFIHVIKQNKTNNRDEIKLINDSLIFINFEIKFQILIEFQISITIYKEDSFFKILILPFKI